MTFKIKLALFIMLGTILGLVGKDAISPTCGDCNPEPYVVFDTTVVTNLVTTVDTVTNTIQIVRQMVEKVEVFKTDTLVEIQETSVYVTDSIYVYPGAEVIYLEAYGKLIKKIDTHFEGSYTVYTSFNKAYGGGEYFTVGRVGVYETSDLCCVEWYEFAGKMVPGADKQMDVEVIWNPEIQ